MLFFGLLVGLPILVQAWPNQTVAIADAFYRSGSLIFGGEHVVLPLLQAEVVPHGWVTFLARYGAAQAVPGQLFYLLFISTKGVGQACVNAECSGVMKIDIGI